MMDGGDDLPNNFDVIVVGTGMVESIVAASASRIGKTVLHLDRNMYYGDLWATLGLENIEDFGKAYLKAGEGGEPVVELDSSESTLYLMSSSLPISNLAYKWFIPRSLPEIKKETIDSKKTENEETVAVSILELGSDKGTENTKCTDTISCDNPSEFPIEVISTDTLAPKYPDENSAQPEKDELKAEPDNCFKEDIKNMENIIEEPKELKKWSIELLKQQSRKFNIDLAPKVMYSGGAMVELLLRSCVHRYTEFQCVSKILAYMDSSGLLEEVPCTKSQVFSCKTFSIVDKRILMKVLNYCINFDSINEPQYDDLKVQMFVDVLKSKNTPEHLILYILEAVAMSTCQTLMAEACSKIKLFFNNVGRYGHSPFLWPLYGSGELLQAFCRLSAVYGGVYYLGRGAEAVLVAKEDNQCVGVVSSGKQIKAQHVVTSAYTCPKNFIYNNSSPPVYISRTILFTDRPLHEKTVVKTKESIVILHMPCKDNSSTTPVQIVQLPSITGSCPKQLYVVQVTCQQSKPCWNEVKQVIDKLFEVNNNCGETDHDCTSNEDNHSQLLIDKLSDPTLKDWFTHTKDSNKGKCESDADRPRIMFAFHYDLNNTDHISFNDTKPTNLHFCHGPDPTIDFKRAIDQAKEIFAQMYPDEEFLEPTPDPNNITLSDLIGEDNSTSNEKQTQEDEKKTGEEQPEDSQNQSDEAVHNKSNKTELNKNVTETQIPNSKETRKDQKPVEE